MQDFVQTIILGAAGIMVCVLIFATFAKPAADRALARRLEVVKAAYSSKPNSLVNAQLRRIIKANDSSLDQYLMQMIPNPDHLRKRLRKTGKKWTLGQFVMVSAGLAVVVLIGALIKGLPVLLAFLLALAVGLGLPHFVVGVFINKRIKKFNGSFPDAIDLLVRGLKSGLPITETIGVVASEIPGPVGIEFRMVTDAMRIGKTLDQSLMEVSERIDTPEFKFFTITLNIQRETGGNLAETLSNLGEVLRKRAQMKLKINAMSSESKASAYIIGSLPFFVFGIISFINPVYMGGFFTDDRLITAGMGGLVWMSIGAYIMREMINFEI